MNFCSKEDYGRQRFPRTRALRPSGLRASQLSSFTLTCPSLSTCAASATHPGHTTTCVHGPHQPVHATRLKWCHASYMYVALIIHSYLPFSLLYMRSQHYTSPTAVLLHHTTMRMHESYRPVHAMSLEWCHAS